MPNAEPKTLHVWMPDGRSLCDRRARPERGGAVPAVEEHEAERAIAASAPACGACLMLVSYLRTDAAVLLEQASVYPETPSTAWRSLAGTRWAHRFDPVAFSETPDLDTTSRFDAVLAALDPEKTRRALDRQREEAAATDQWIRDYWSRQATT